MLRWLIVHKHFHKLVLIILLSNADRRHGLASFQKVLIADRETISSRDGLVFRFVDLWLIILDRNVGTESGGSLDLAHNLLHLLICDRSILG